MEIDRNSGLDDEDWLAYANCTGVDPKLFFPERGDSRTLQTAKTVCAGCIVREECLEYALANNEKFGLWGGKSDRERRRMRKERRDGGAS